MSKWSSYDFDNFLIILESKKSLLVNLDDEYKTWLPLKLVKKREDKSSFISCDEFEHKIFKTKKVNDEYKRYDEKIINISELLKRLKKAEDELICFSIKKRYIRKQTEKAYLIGFTDLGFKFNSFWLPKKSTKKSTSSIIVGLIKNFIIKVSYADNDSGEYIYKEYTPEKLSSYLFEQEYELNNLMYSRPEYIKPPKNVEIDEALKDDFENYSETGVLQTRTKLLKHQRKAVAKILPTKTGALFMEMGTGKTRVTLELIKIRQNKISKVIWITPVSLKYNLLLEIEKHTNLSRGDIYIFNHKTDETNVPKKQFYIVGIESIGMSDRVYLTLNKLVDSDTFVIMDESSFIKGNSKQTRRVISLSKDTRYRMILTGTPISQGIADLYSQFNFLSPKIFGYLSFYSFASKHLRYSKKYPGMIAQTYNEKFLAEKMKPYVYQITKKKCLELPKKQYINRYFDMTIDQREFYEKAKNEILFGGYDEEGYYLNCEDFAIFELFNALQQIVSGYWKKDEKITETDNPRIDLLENIIKEIKKDEKIIIWAKFKYDIQQIVKMLETKFKDERFVLYTGEQSETEKNSSLYEFTHSAAKFFIATHGTGAYGLNLVQSSIAIFYNNNFKYSQRIQAEDRIHRFGQGKQVTYINITCDNSIDIEIDNALYSKSNVVSNFRREIDKIKDKRLKTALLNAIIDGDLKKAEDIKNQAKKSSGAQRMEKYRRKKGIIPRSEYIENSLSFKKPWAELGISRATWYRKYQKS